MKTRVVVTLGILLLLNMLIACQAHPFTATGSVSVYRDVKACNDARFKRAESSQVVGTMQRGESGYRTDTSYGKDWACYHVTLQNGSRGYILSGSDIHFIETDQNSNR